MSVRYGSLAHAGIPSICYRHGLVHAMGPWLMLAIPARSYRQAFAAAPWLMLAFPAFAMDKRGFTLWVPGSCWRSQHVAMDERSLWLPGSCWRPNMCYGQALVMLWLPGSGWRPQLAAIDKQLLWLPGFAGVPSMCYRQALVTLCVVWCGCVVHGSGWPVQGMP